MTLGSVRCGFLPAGLRRSFPIRRTFRGAAASWSRPVAIEGFTDMSARTLTFVLVPGAYQGGWSWQPVAHRLRAAGHHAVTLTLPGLADGDPRTGWHLSDAMARTPATDETLQPAG